MMIKPDCIEALDQISKSNDSKERRVLLRGGTVLSMDAKIGDLKQGDVLIEGKKIVAVGQDLSDAASDPDTLVVDLDGRILVPGFQDVHRHCWQGQVRRSLPDVSSVGEYLALFHDSLAKAYRPEDIYIGNLVTSLSCIDNGVTNVHDLMHNPRTAEHADAAITAMQDAGIRATHSQCGVFSGTQGSQWPEDLVRIKSQYFSSDDQLLTLRLGVIGSANFSPGSIALSRERLAFARDLGVSLTSDGVIGKACSDQVVELGRAGLLGEDILLTHCLDLSDECWQLMADNGVGVALTPTSDAQFGIANSIAPIQKVIDLNIQNAGVGIDTEINLSPDYFVQLQAMLTIQRMLIFNRRYTEGFEDARGLTVKDVFEFATIKGARATQNDKKVGSITPGKEADLVIIDPADINNFPINTVYGTVISGCDSRNIEAVMIAGRFKKWSGKLVGQDLAAIRKRAEQSRDYVYEKSGLIYNFFEAPKVDIEGRDYHGHGAGAKG